MKVLRLSSSLLMAAIPCLLDYDQHRILLGRVAGSSLHAVERGARIDTACSAMHSERKLMYPLASLFSLPPKCTEIAIRGQQLYVGREDDAASDSCFSTDPSTVIANAEAVTLCGRQRTWPGEAKRWRAKCCSLYEFARTRYLLGTASR